MPLKTKWLNCHSLYVILILSFSHLVYSADVEIVTIEAEGMGNTREEAINDALREAVARVNGVSVASNTRAVTGGSTLSVDTNTQAAAVAVGRVDTQSAGQAKSRQYKEGENPGSANVSDVTIATTTRGQAAVVSASTSRTQQTTSYNASQIEISVKSGGQIKNYKVLDVQQSEAGFIARASASIAKLKLSPESLRTRLAIVPFRIKKPTDRSREFERQFSQTLISQLSQSGKFAVLDRDYLEEQGVELNRLQAGEVPIDEMAKLGNKLTTDFIVVGSIDEVVARKRVIVMKSTGQEIPMVDQGARLSFRLIEAATAQVKFSDSFDNVKSTQGSVTATSIIGRELGRVVAQNILINLFPVRVEGVRGDNVVLGQGGDTITLGQKFNLVQYGKELFDSYTKESLGRVEKNVGIVEVVEIQSKQTYARIVESSIDFADAFKVESFIVRPIPNVSKTATKKVQSKKVKDDAAKRIKALEQSSDDDW